MSSAEGYHKPQSHRRLTRSPHGMIAGVCAGLSECFGINLIFIRTVFIVLTLAEGIGIALYLILIILIPASPQPRAAGAAVACSNPTTRKTLFSYLAGGLGILVGALAFLNDASSAFEFIRRTFNGNAPHVYVEPPDPYSPAPPNQLLSVAPGIVGVQGSARVVWDVGGVTHQGDIEMFGPFGEGFVAYRDIQSLEQVMVYQRLSMEHMNQELFLIGSDPSHVEYIPDIFKLSMNGDGSLNVIASCDRLHGCYPIQSSYGLLQVVSR